METESSEYDTSQVLNEINKKFEKEYPNFGKTLEMNGNLNISKIKLSFKKKINLTKNDEEKIPINMAYEYFLNLEDELKSYDEKDLKKFKKFLKFNPNLLIVINDLERLKAYLQEQPESFDQTFDKSKRSPLYFACKCGYIKIVKFLLEKGCKTEKEQSTGSIPLHAACYFGHKEIVDLLLEVGSPHDVKNSSGNLPEDEASEDIVPIIKKYKADNLYNFFINNRKFTGNIKLMFDDMELVGKRCHFDSTYKDWDLAWHGTKLISIPSILTHGFKKPKEKAGDKEIALRPDKDEKDRVGRIQHNKTVNNVPNWAEAVFTSCSFYYSTTRVYAEHINDHKDEEWVIVLECRLKKNSYKKYGSTVPSFKFNSKEDEGDDRLVENRSENSEDVKVSAIWYFKKKFVLGLRDKSKMLKKIKKFID